MAIPDEEFIKYSTLERSNLLFRFTGLHCTDLHCPGFDDPLSSETTGAQTNMPTKAVIQLPLIPGSKN